MATSFRPLEKTNLSDDLTDRIAEMIRSGTYRPGDRLPAIMEMARTFGVGHPTVREALKKLEALGIVEIKHGSGVYVRQDQDTLLLTNPVYSGMISKKMLLDLIDARIPIEMTAVERAATQARTEHLDRMRALLDQAEQHLDDITVLSPTNMAFHREIAVASGNTVLAQLQEVLGNLFQQEQRLILDIFGSREQDHREHVQIFEALQQRDVRLACERMRAHLEGVREALQRWNPKHNPLP